MNNIRLDECRKRLEELAEDAREAIPKSTTSNYSGGYDRGYALGSAHAFESALDFLKLLESKDVE